MDEEVIRLLKKSWTIVNLHSKNYYLKYEIGINGYEVLLSDLRAIYHERLDRDKMTKRNREVNPVFEITAEKLCEQIESMLSNFASHVTETEQSEKHLIVKTCVNLSSDWEFLWTFNLTLESQGYFWCHLVQPLFGMVAELLHQKRRLIDIIEKKDAEIQDYKIGGAVVSRKYIETLPFSKDDFEKSFCVQNTKEVVLQAPPLVFSDASNLYLDVVDVLAENKRKHDDKPKLVVPTKAETTDKIVPPQKTGSSTEVEEGESARDIEARRRRELESQLTSTASVPKKKKKKVKL